MEEIAEIRAADKAFRTDAEFLQLRSRWDTDFDLYRMKPYDAGKGYYSYTSNSPRILVTRTISLITSSKLLIRVPLDTLTEAQRNTANNLERLLYGILALNDAQLANRNLPSTIEQLAWHAILRGGVAIRPYLYKSKDGKTLVDLAIWDLYTTSYVMGATGTSWASYTTLRSKADIEEQYGIKLYTQEKNIEVVDHWNTKKHGVFANNQWLDKLHPHELDHCPVYIILAGTQPPASHSTYTYPNIHRGESVLSMNRLEAPIMNKVISDYATIVRRGVKTPLGYWSAGGKKTLESDIYQVEKAAAISMDSLTNEKIAPLLEPTMPADAKALVEILLGEEQRGGLSHLALGELGFRLSGFAINQLTSNLESVIEPYITAVERSLELGLVCAYEQYASGKYPTLKVRGRDSRNKAFGYPTEVAITPDEIETSWRPEVKLVPIMPKDDAQKTQIASMWKRDNFASLDTIQDSLLGIDDPQQEQQKMSREWANSLVLNRLYDAYMAFVVDGQYDKAENVRVELERVMAAQGPPAGGKQPPANDLSALDQAAMENRGVGLPAQDVGMGPETLPSEALGGMPGGALSAGGI